MKVSKYLRGSGRFLAFVFVASVLWLLFDMAALRLSITDVKGQFMKDLVLKERELAKRQNSNPTDLRHYPVRKVNPDTEASRRSEMLKRQVVEVYRRKKPGRINGENNNKAAPNPSGNILTVTLSKVVAGNDPKVRVDTKSFGQNGLLEKQNSPSYKVSPGMVKKEGVLTKTKAPSAGQEGQRPKLQSNDTQNHQIPPPQDFNIPQGVILSNKSNSALNKVRLDASTNIPPKQKHSVQMVQMVDKRKSVAKGNKADSLPVKILVQVTAKPPNIQTGELNSMDETKQDGLHKVLNLDVTLKPRDSRALGQFGWAAEVPVDDLEESRRRWSEGYFNVFLSEQIPVDRAVPDTRPPACVDLYFHSLHIYL